MFPMSGRQQLIVCVITQYLSELLISMDSFGSRYFLWHGRYTKCSNKLIIGYLTICTRDDSLNAHGATVCDPVWVCNLSVRAVEIPPKSLLCSLSSVSVVDSWTPGST